MKEKVNDALEAALPARVPQPHRRDDRLPRAVARRGHPDRRPDDQAGHRASSRARASASSSRSPPRSCSPNGATTRRSALGRCAGRSSVTSRIRCPRSILYKEFRAGEIIVVDTEDDPDSPARSAHVHGRSRASSRRPWSSPAPPTAATDGQRPHPFRAFAADARRKAGVSRVRPRSAGQGRPLAATGRCSTAGRCKSTPARWDWALGRDMRRRVPNLVKFAWVVGI